MNTRMFSKIAAVLGTVSLIALGACSFAASPLPGGGEDTAEVVINVSPISARILGAFAEVFAGYNRDAGDSARAYLYLTDLDLTVTETLSEKVVYSGSLAFTVGGPQQVAENPITLYLEPGLEYRFDAFGYNDVEDPASPLSFASTTYTVTTDVNNVYLTLIPNNPTVLGEPTSATIFSSIYNPDYVPADPESSPILSAGGERWFSFTADATAARIGINPGTASVYAALFHENGKFIAGKASDNLTTEGPGYIDFTGGVTLGETVYLGIVAFTQETAADVPVSVEKLTPIPDDSYEDNDTFDTAIELTLPMAGLSLNLVSLDQDFFYFTLPEPGVYEVTVVGDGVTNLDGELMLYDTSGTPAGEYILAPTRSVQISSNQDNYFTLMINLNYRHPDYGYPMPVEGYTLTIEKINSPPTALISASASEIDLGGDINLSGALSSDPDNDVLSYAWSVNSGPDLGTSQFDDTASQTPVFTPTLAGSYTLTLEVTDSFGLTSVPATVSLTVNEAYVPPAVPTNLIAVPDANISQSLVLLSWDQVPDATGYDLWRAQDAAMESYLTVYHIDSSSTTFLDDSVVSGTEYFYTIETIRGEDSSDPSAPIAVTTTADYALGVETGSASGWFGGYSSGSATGGGQSLIVTQTTILSSFALRFQGFAVDGGGTLPAEVTIRLNIWDNAGTWLGSFDKTIDPGSWTVNWFVWENLDTPLFKDQSYIFVAHILDADTTFVKTSIEGDSAEPYLDGSRYSGGGPTGTNMDDFATYSSLSWDTKFQLVGTALRSAAINNPPAAGAMLVAPEITLGGDAQLDGSASYDPDYDMLDYLWTVESAPAGSVAGFSDPYAMSPTFTPDFVGYYTLRLTVADGRGGSDYIDLYLTVSDSIDPKPYLVNAAGFTIDANTWSALSSSDLYYEDVDTPPSGIFYYLDHIDYGAELRLNGTAIGIWDSFSQADVDAGYVSFASVSGNSGEYMVRLRVEDSEGHSPTPNYCDLFFTVIGDPIQSTVGIE